VQEKKIFEIEITVNTSSQACSQQIEFCWTAYQWQKTQSTQDPVKRMPPGGCTLFEGSHHRYKEYKIDEMLKKRSIPDKIKKT
jgi:hypothetical protein